MRKLLTSACIAVILLTTWLPLAGASAKEQSPLSVLVVSSEGVPVKDASVSLWDHGATPSRLLIESTTNERGIATFAVPKAQGESGGHHSVLVSAPGHSVASWHWSERRTDTDAAHTAGTPVPRYIEVSLPLSVAAESHLTGSSIKPLSHVGAIRHRLEWWDYNSYRNINTTVAWINQVGWMESRFAFETRVDTVMDVAVMAASTWTTSGSNSVTRSVANTISWHLAATQNENVYWQQRCMTQFDYRLELYVIEQFQDDGDVQQWVRIGTQYKFYAHSLNVNATPSGSQYQIQIGDPAQMVSWTGNSITPGGGRAKVLQEVDQVDRALEFTVLFATVRLGLRHVTSATSIWTATNTAPTGGRTYILGVGFNRVWFFKPLP